jgi:hypothetical protein
MVGPLAMADAMSDGCKNARVDTVHSNHATDANARLKPSTCMSSSITSHREPHKEHVHISLVTYAEIRINSQTSFRCPHHPYKEQAR